MEMLGLDKPIWWREGGCQKWSLHLLEQCPERWQGKRSESARKESFSKALNI